MKKVIALVILVSVFLAACDRAWEVPVLQSPIKPTPSVSPTPCYFHWTPDKALRSDCAITW